MLRNKIVLVSGASGRLGSAFCKVIADNGGKVVMVDVNIEAGEKLVGQIGIESTLFVAADATDTKQLDEAVRLGVQRFGKIDAAVHSAYPRSSGWGAKFEDLNPQMLFEDLNKQLGGAILFSQRIIAHFRKQGWGNLIHISSIQGIAAPKFEHYEGTQMVSPIEYSAIKSGVISVVRYLAKYCKGQNIRVNCLSPGGILDMQSDSFLQKYKASCSTKGMLDAEDITGALVFLLSDGSKYVNGQNILVDDGWAL